MPPDNGVDTLLSRLGYGFRRRQLALQALTHRSQSADHNERLEFIGDAVLDCVVAEVLYERFSRTQEGDLSRLRANLVNQDTLARLAAELGLGAYLRLGEGEQRSGGAARPSILADALEALFGAVFIDGGFDAARDVVRRVFAGELAGLDPAAVGKDPKTRLQEWLQARRIAVPEYTVIDISGEAHAQAFEVECRIAALDTVATGAGASRRAAEQAAAARVYELLAASPQGERRGG